MWIFKDYRLLTKSENIELLKIRNDKFVREASNDSSVISYEDHMKWIMDLDDKKRYMALFIDDSVVGGLNYQAEDSNIKNWGIFFDKNLPPLISLVATYLFIEHMFEKYDVLYSEVLKDNEKALRFNQYFGVRKIGEKESSYRLELTKNEWEKHKKSFQALEKRVKSIKYRFECQEGE